MPEQNYNIAIQTTGDTTGAVKVDQAIKQVTQSTEKFNASNVAMAGKSRNSSMALLEFSRGFEDLQYGVRGVLNNIPPLVMSLGGGAGLAGVISLAAVSLSMLGNVFDTSKDKIKGAGDNADTAKTKLNEAAKAYANFWKSGSEARKEALHEDDSTLKKLLGGIDNQRKTANDSIGLRASLETAQETIGIIRERMALGTIESAMEVATGEKLLGLAKQREASVKAIFDMEQGIADIARRKEIDQATNNLVAADMKVSATAGGDAGAMARYASLNQENTALRHEAARLRETKQGEIDITKKLITEKGEELQRVRDRNQNIKGVGFGGGPEPDSFLKQSELEGDLATLRATLAETLKLLQGPNSAEGRANIKQPELDTLKTRLEASAKAQADAASEMGRATIELSHLKQVQESQKGLAAAKYAESETAKLGRVVTQAMRDALTEIRASMAAKGDTGNKGGFPGMDSPEAAAVKQIEGMLTDTTPDANQAGGFAGVLQQLADSLSAKENTRIQQLNRLVNMMKIQAENDKTMNDRINDLSGQIRQTR